MLDEAGRGEGKGCIPSNTSQATIDLCDCSVGHNGILIWTANPTIIFIRKVNLLNGLSTFDCFIDSWLTWNTALRVGVLLVRIEVRHWQVTRMNAYVLCSDGNSNSNSSWLMTHPPPLLSPFLFFLTKTNSYSQLTTKRTHKRAYNGFCSFCIPWLSYVPTPQWVFVLKCLWYFDKYNFKTLRLPPPDG